MLAKYVIMYDIDHTLGQQYRTQTEYVRRQRFGQQRRNVAAYVFRIHFSCVSFWPIWVNPEEPGGVLCFSDGRDPRHAGSGGKDAVAFGL